MRFSAGALPSQRRFFCGLTFLLLATIGMAAVALCLVVIGALMRDICCQPIDRYDNDLPLTDMDIITETNPLETEEGEPLIEGDILLPKLPKDMENEVEDELQVRKGLLNVISLWPSGRVTYNFHSSVDSKTRDNIRAAIGEWERETCLKFHETAIDVSYIRFRTDRSGCWSMVGRQNSFLSGQDISIGPGCERKSVIVHEIGHAIGLYHEQSRGDRNSYITILWHNIPSGLHSQFSTGLDYSRGVEYDYTSVMHYSSMAFSKKPFERNTIVTKNPHYQRLIGTGRKISFRDAKLVNKMYSCNAFCPNLLNESQSCQNGGYLSPHRGNNSCHCVCPPETTGQYCEQETKADYYSPPICGGNVTEEEEIQTPGYPKRELPNDSCSWWIQAPPGKRVMVTFQDFSFYPRLASKTSKYRGRCLQERVEIRTTNMAEGYMYCGEDIKPGTNLASSGRDFMIIITTPNGYQGTRGLKAKVSFID